MSRYFLEVSYLGTGYAGFQKQSNAITIQSEVEKVLLVYFRTPIGLTGSSRTDAGVHAFQNFFHFDFPSQIDPTCIYNLNAMLPSQIVIKSLHKFDKDAHARFDAVAREYNYTLNLNKEPFLYDRSFFYPYALDVPLLQEAAAVLLQYNDFSTFSKRGSQVKTNLCNLYLSNWKIFDDKIVYEVKGNRFLRGMVRGLVGTMLLVGRKKIDISGFKKIIESKEVKNANFAVPGHGLTLVKVHYPASFFQ